MTLPRAPVLLQFNLADTILSSCLMPCTISIWCCDMILPALLYDIHLRATHMTTSSIGGVQIPIYLVSSTTDSLQQSVVVLKLYQQQTQTLGLSSCVNLVSKYGTYRSPLNTSYAWDISRALATLYHPYAHEPSALTEYLKRKLQVQRAKCQSRSHPAHVKQNVPLERNMAGKREMGI